MLFLLVCGIICEYNPLHLGHAKQIRIVRKLLGADTAVVCLMSGNYVQRGAPAIVDKQLRAKAAVLSGADLVLELPVTCALSSAEGFAAGGVEILSSFCDYLCFGAETSDADALMGIAKALLSDAFPPLLRSQLDRGLSFPAARAAALEEMGLDSSLVDTPNNILAVEYCKAILAKNTSMKPLPIPRQGSYHDETPDPENPSATAVRRLMLKNKDVIAHRSADRRGNLLPEHLPYIPKEVHSVFSNAPLHALAAGEQAILYRLRTMTDAEFEALPYGSEGLWRKFMHASRSCATLEQIIAATKSKRYTRTRIDRMILCAFLGITREMLAQKPPYTRVLAFNDVGRSVLKQAKQHTACINAGEAADHPYWELEQRCGDLYGLFCVTGPEAPGAEAKRRIFYRPNGVHL